MLVSEICKQFDLSFIRDGEFNAVALLGLRRNNRDKHIAYILGAEYLQDAVKEKCECIIIPPEIIDEAKSVFGGGICVSNDPKTSLFKVHELLTKNISLKETTISSSAIISPKAIISERGVTIGDNTIIEENVIIRENTIIGEGCHIMAGSVIGNPAFYFYGNSDNKKMVYSSGGVQIHNNVSIHSNVSICKGVIGGMTVLHDNVSLDSLVFIGHDCIIGRNTNLAGGCSLAGWVEIGSNCFLGMNATAAPAVKVADNVDVSIGAVLTKNVDAKCRVSGNFAIEHTAFITNLKRTMEGIG